MQKISKELYSRPLIGRDTFYVNIDEGIKIKYNISYTSSLFDLLKSYSAIIKKDEIISNLTINLSELQTVENSIQRIKNMFGSLKEWTNFLTLIPKLSSNNIINKSYISSNFVASLELTKNDLIEMKQTETFGNIYIKNKFND